MPKALPVLYSFRRCPYAMRARLAIAVSGHAVELREVVLRAKPADLITASAKATVPVLVLPDGKVIDESLDIMRWALACHDPLDWLRKGQPDDWTQERIAECDGKFKHHLDRYKYPNRYGGEDAVAHRDAGAAWLQSLADRLEQHAMLLGEKPSLADMAIAPFVRQFAETNRPWFDSQPWFGLSHWLDTFLKSELFAQVMEKQPHWSPGTVGNSFPALPPRF
ncbi:MAG: glutathione S-transferase [Pseudomonadota bacterium]